MDFISQISKKYENSPRSIVLTDFRGNIVDCNNSWLKLCGYRREEVINRSNSILQGPLTEREIVEEIERAISRKETVDVVVTNFKKNGAPFKNNLLISPLEDGFMAEITDLGISDYEKQFNRRLAL
tara:strand:- start:1733 stop:2110 length:378 start_codon:yes stop_codon:yes gene_type:complete